MTTREALEALIDRIPATANAEREYEIVSEALDNTQRALDAAMQYVPPKDRDWIDALAAGKNA